MKKDDIKYIALEGGGGKGNAFYGAVKALEDEKILQFQNHKLVGQIDGISGASAGAITAFFIGSGFSSMELKSILLETKFNNFFDKPKANEVCVAGKGFTTMMATPNPFPGIDNFAKFIISRSAGELLGPLISLIFPTYLVELITSNLSGYLECLAKDYGLFSGRVIQETFFERYLWYKLFCINIGFKPSQSEPISKECMAFADYKISTFKDSNNFQKEAWTFKKHFQTFQKKLVFTSVNFRTGQIQRFSVDTTPDFPISTAVRMSMSLPLIFKPVIINSDSLSLCGLKDKFWEGLWVDGGLFDNAPLANRKTRYYYV
jgi:predicted acylesterase/phospholipase RssA